MLCLRFYLEQLPNTPKYGSVYTCEEGPLLVCPECEYARSKEEADIEKSTKPFWSITSLQLGACKKPHHTEDIDHKEQ